MAKFKHKPTLVDAFFWTGTIEADFPSWLAGRSQVIETALEIKVGYLPKAIEKDMWIIRKQNGELQVFNKPAFEARFESAE